VFDIGFFELLLVATVGLIVIGPERLPDTIRTVSLWIGRIKRSLRETRVELEQQLGADDIRRQLHNEEIMQKLSSTQENILKDEPTVSKDNTANNQPAIEQSPAPPKSTGTENKQILADNDKLPTIQGE
jgi:Tat protein translocase TatB subunit